MKLTSNVIIQLKIKIKIVDTLKKQVIYLWYDGSHEDKFRTSKSL